MSVRTINRRPLRKISIGDMRTPAGLYLAVLTASMTVDPVREFKSIQDPWFCSVRTVSGITAFGDSNVEEVVTHIFEGRFIEGTSDDHFIKHDGRFFRIITVEDLDERKEFMQLKCTERGIDTLLVNYG